MSPCCVLALALEARARPGTCEDAYAVRSWSARSLMTAGLALLLVRRLDPAALSRVLANVTAAMCRRSRGAAGEAMAGHDPAGSTAGTAPTSRCSVPPFAPRPIGGAVVTVYVDNMRGYARVDRGGGRAVTGRWSHLLADDPDELAGVRCAARACARSGSSSPGTPREHYDVVEAVRRRAVAAGAVPISYPHGTGNLIATKRLQASALDAASRGWHVFPLRPGTKIPAVRHWEHEATTDPERIRDLWTARLRRRTDGTSPSRPTSGSPADRRVWSCSTSTWPSPAKTAPGGRSSGATTTSRPARTCSPCLADAGRAERARDLRGRHSRPAVGTCTSPHPTECAVRNSTGHLGPMIDVRGEGGYVVAAGSRLHALPSRRRIRRDRASSATAW